MSSEQGSIFPSFQTSLLRIAESLVVGKLTGTRQKLQATSPSLNSFNGYFI